MMEPILLEGHSEDIRVLKEYLKGIRKTFEGYFGTHGTRALEHVKHSGTWRALRHSGTQGIRAMWESRHLRHFTSQIPKTLSCMIDS